MNITIKTIPHEDQRYETVGDWLFDADGNLEIRVSSVGDWRTEALVAFHELAEVLMCKHNGISQSEVDLFDIEFEKRRPVGDVSEPGDRADAPYHDAHQFATIVERALARELGVNWQHYEQRLAAL